MKSLKLLLTFATQLSVSNASNESDWMVNGHCDWANVEEGLSPSTYSSVDECYNNDDMCPSGEKCGFWPLWGGPPSYSCIQEDLCNAHGRYQENYFRIICTGGAQWKIDAPGMTMDVQMKFE